MLHTIDWWAAKGSFQYYFPGSGRMFVAGNFTYAHSRNIGKLFPKGGAEIELLGSVADKSLSGDASLLFDATPAIRFGLSGQYTQVRYLANAATPSAVQHPRDRAGALHVLENRRSTTATTVAVVVVPPVVSLAMDAGRTRAAWVAMFASAFAGVACRRSAEAPGPAAPRADARVDGAPRVDGSRRDAVATDGEAAASDEDDATAAARLNAAICRRPRCCVTRVIPAGIGTDGTRYTVVRVDLHPGRRRCAPPQTGEQEDVVDPAAIKANEQGENDAKVCERYRWDLVAEQGAKLRWRQPLEIDQWCISAFGMGGGEDGMSADAAARTISYSHEFGSASRSNESVTVGVDPLRVVQTSTRSWRTIGSDGGSVAWNWDTFSGTQSSSTVLSDRPRPGRWSSRPGARRRHRRSGRARRRQRQGDRPDGHAAGRVREGRVVGHVVPQLRGARRRQGSWLHDSWARARRQR